MYQQLFREMLAGRRFEEMRQMAQTLLDNEQLSTREKAVCHDALALAHSFLNDHGKAVPAGEIAVYLARESGDFDLLGEAIYHSGIVYGRRRWHEPAADRFEEYFQYLSLYTTAKELQPKVLFNQGVAYRWLRDYRTSVKKLRQAWELVRETQGQRQQNYRWDLVWVCMLAGELDGVPELLAQGRAYLNQHPEDREAYFQQLNDEARYALLTGDLADAYKKAMEVIKQGDAFPDMQAVAGLTVHYLAVKRGMHLDALIIGCYVKQKAAAARRPDLDEEISKSIIEIDARSDGALMRELLNQLGYLRPSPKSRGK